jgi:hemoglobin
MKRITPFLYLTLAAFAPIAPFCAAPPQAVAQQQKSLYQRLGGYDALAAVTDDFIGRIATDPQLKHFFVGHNKEGLTRIRQQSSTFCASRPAAPAPTPART